MAMQVSEELLGAIVPTVVYWIYSGMYAALSPFMDKYRLHPTGDEDTKNISTRSEVVRGVLLEQFFQIAFFLLVFMLKGGSSETDHVAKPETSLPTIGLQIVIAMVVLDTWQYFMHRLLHVNKFLYKHIHAKHHRLVVPYAYGALYNHPVEGFILDTVGGSLAFLASGMSPRTALFFFSFATMKSVDDHCGLWIPWNPLQAWFRNNSACHDVHHQLYGNKFNYAAPFFVTWDKLLGTYMPYTVEKRHGGGYEICPIKED